MSAVSVGGKGVKRRRSKGGWKGAEGGQRLVRAELCSAPHDRHSKAVQLQKMNDEALFMLFLTIYELRSGALFGEQPT